MLPWSVKNYPLLPARSQVLILLHRQTHSQISPLHSRLLRLLGLFSMLETTALPSHPQTICSPLLRRLHCLQGKDQGRLSEELKLCGILTVLWVFNMPFVYTYSAHASAEQSHRKRMICNSAAVIPLSSTRKVRVVMNTVQTCDVVFPYWHLISVVNDQWSRGRVIPIGHSAPLPRSGLFPSNYVEQLWIKMIVKLLSSSTDRHPTQPSGPEQCSAPSPDTILPIPASRPTKHGSVSASPTRLLRSEASNARYATSATSPGWRRGATRRSSETQVRKIRISGWSSLLSVDVMRPDIMRRSLVPQLLLV